MHGGAIQQNKKILLGNLKTQDLTQDIFGDQFQHTIQYYIQKNGKNRPRLVNNYKKLKHSVGRFYQNVNSNKQISTIIKYGGARAFGKVLEILSNSIHPSLLANLARLLLENKTDDQIYSFLEVKPFKRP